MNATAVVVAIAILGTLVGVSISERRREQRFTDCTMEQVAEGRKTMVRADYRVKLERHWAERFFRVLRRIEVGLRIAVTRRDGPGTSAGSRM